MLLACTGELRAADEPRTLVDAQLDDIYDAFVTPLMAPLLPTTRDHHRRFMISAGHGERPDSLEAAIAEKSWKAEDIAVSGRVRMRNSWIGARLTGVEYAYNEEVDSLLEGPEDEPLPLVQASDSLRYGFAAEAWLLPVSPMTPVRGASIWGSYGARRTSSSRVAHNLAYSGLAETREEEGSYRVRWSCGIRSGLLLKRTCRIVVTIDGEGWRDTSTYRESTCLADTHAGDCYGERQSRKMFSHGDYRGEIAWLPKLGGPRFLAAGIGARLQQDKHIVPQRDDAHVSYRRVSEDSYVEHTVAPSGYVFAGYAARRQSGIARLYIGESLKAYYTRLRKRVLECELSQWGASARLDLLAELRAAKLSVFTGVHAVVGVTRDVRCAPDYCCSHNDNSVTESSTDLLVTPLAFDWRMAPTIRLVCVPRLYADGAFLWQMELRKGFGSRRGQRRQADTLQSYSAPSTNASAPSTMRR
ncbi:MAG: hypothetical protein GF331_07245 [Chitinivibrionales bacterium]|nr:hypothetical protein [Chitinivibrionales bacterium]